MSTHDDVAAIAQNVLDSRREGDTCDRNKCFYPAVIQLAEGALRLEAKVRELEAEQDSWRAHADRWAEQLEAAEAREAKLRAALEDLAKLERPADLMRQIARSALAETEEEA